MTGVPLEETKVAAQSVVDHLSPADCLEVVAFDSSPTRYIALTAVVDKAKLKTDLSRIQAGGGTSILGALQTARDDLARVSNVQRRHIVLMTDGRSAIAGLRETAAELGAQGVTVSTLSLGEEADAAILDCLAHLGKGRYMNLKDTSKLKAVLKAEIGSILP